MGGPEIPANRLGPLQVYLEEILAPEIAEGSRMKQETLDVKVEAKKEAKNEELKELKDHYRQYVVDNIAKNAGEGAEEKEEPTLPCPRHILFILLFFLF